MGLHVAKILTDVRRGDGPPGVRHYTFSALVTIEALITCDPEQVAAAVRALGGECRGDRPSSWAHRNEARASDKHSTVRVWQLMCWAPLSSR